MQVDDLLQDNNVRLRGDDTGVVDAVIFRHAGFMLYPTADQLEGNEVDCAAMLVPRELVPQSISQSE